MEISEILNNNAKYYKTHLKPTLKSSGENDKQERTTYGTDSLSLRGKICFGVKSDIHVLQPFPLLVFFTQMSLNLHKQ